MTTETGLYENTHGKSPKGYGLWWFKITGTDNKGSYTTDELSATGKLTEAKAAACRRMKQEIAGVKTITNIIVLP